MEDPGIRQAPGGRRSNARHLVELERLRQEVDQLRRENVLLRSEVTRLRLYQDIDLDASAHPVPLPDSVPTDAQRFYRVLPEAFNAVEFFRMAGELGIPAVSSSRYMDLFLRERLLQRIAQDQLCKVDRHLSPIMPS